MSENPRGENRAAPALPDVPAILAALVEHQVDFVVIGGVAVAYHGFLRATGDVDIVPGPTADNLVRRWEALAELEAKPESHRHFRPEEVPAPLTLDALLELGNWDLETKHGRLHLLQFVPGKIEQAQDYQRLRGSAEAGRYDFGTVWFASYEDILDFKTIAGRDQDLIDIRALREARGDTAP